MSKICLETFLSKADEIANEKPSYQLGHDGSDGKCDCIGYIIGSIRRSGGKWTGIHGSNYSARNEMEYQNEIQNSKDLKIGEAVYKAAQQGQSNYNLPDRYSEHEDKKDYYHVGIVRSVTPLKIVHCTGPGIVVDTKLGKWNYHGWLKKVSLEGELPMSTTKSAIVIADNGSTVNMRKTPDGDLLDRVPVGATVSIIGENGDWYNIFYKANEGWMKKTFLQITEESGQIPNQNSDETVNVVLPRDQAEQLRDALTNAVGWG